jgi:hypothetical protein
MLTLFLTSILIAASPIDTAKAPLRALPSPDSLVSAIVEALNAHDLKRLDALSFNKAEFLEVYPFFETDTSRSRREFATGYYLRDNQKILQRRMDEEGGRKVVLARYDIEGPVVNYGPMVLYKGFRLWVRDTSGTDVEREVKLVKSAARFHDGWKIWSFRDN